MRAPSRSGAPPPRAALRLYAAGGASLALVAPVMALANRSSPLLLGIAAGLFLAGFVVEKGSAAGAELAGPFAAPLGLATLAFLIWCLVSLAWSPFPALSLRMAGEFAPALGAAYCVARIAPGRMPSWTPPLAAALLGLACLYVAASLTLDLAPQRALGQRAADFALNRPVLTLVLLAGPLAALLLTQRRRIAAAAILALTVLAVSLSVSASAMLGLAAGAAMGLLALFLPRRLCLSIAALGLGLGLALSPVEGDLLHRIMPDSLHARLFNASSRARVAIAQSFGAAVAADPWRGAGFGTAARFPEVPAAQGLEPEMRTMLAVGHPHNSFLQIWAELGAVGAILAGTVMLLALGAVAHLPGGVFAAALGLVATAAAIAFVDHGAWAPWWTAGLGAAITWLREAAMGAGSPKERDPA